MKGTKFYKIVITLLIMLNISTIAFVWFTKPPHPPKPGTILLSDELGITGENKVKVDELEKLHHKEKHLLVDNDLKMHKELYEAIGKEVDVADLEKRIADNKNEIEKMTFDFFDAVAQYCSEKQKSELREFVHGAFDQLRPMRPPKK